MTAQVNSINLAGVRLHIRGCVGFQECRLRDGVAYYLSLLEGELDTRLQAFLSASLVGKSRDTQASCREMISHAGNLELTDALILCRDNGDVAALRGGGCSFPLFWHRHSEGLVISTHLPVRGNTPFSRTGLLSAMASVSLQGCYEPNAYRHTVLHDWYRLRRASITGFSGGGYAEELPLVLHMHASDAVTEETVSADIDAAFAAYSDSQQHVTTSVLELSGGFDSTLAGAAAKHAKNCMKGISVQFPFYEFRYEESTQQAVARMLNIDRTVIDGSDLFPYTTCDHMPCFDEPAVFVTGILHAEAVASFAQKHSATQIYTGHGGDQIFSTDLTAPEHVAHSPDRRLFSRTAWNSVKNTVATINIPMWRQRSTGCFVNDARQDVWAKETFGVNVRTPFADLAVFRSALGWSQLNNSQNTSPDKKILAKVLADMLPDEVKERKGKVAYNGVWMRAYATQHDHIAATFDQCAEVLDHIGISVAWLLRRARDLASWKTESDRDLLAAYAVATWLLSWGVEKVNDVSWDR